MKLTHKDFENTRVVKLCEPRLDAAGAVQFKDQMRNLSEEGPERIVLDLQEVEFLDSSGLGAVVAALKAIHKGQTLALADLNPAVQKVFHLTRMDTVFSIYENADLALAPESENAEETP